MAPQILERVRLVLGVSMHSAKEGVLGWGILTKSNRVNRDYRAARGAIVGITRSTKPATPATHAL